MGSLFMAYVLFIPIRQLKQTAIHSINLYVYYIYDIYQIILTVKTIRFKKTYNLPKFQHSTIPTFQQSYSITFNLHQSTSIYINLSSLTTHHSPLISHYFLPQSLSPPVSPSLRLSVPQSLHSLALYTFYFSL